MTDSRAVRNEPPSDSVESPSPLLQVTGLQMHFPVTEGAVLRRTTRAVKAVDGISFELARGETMGMVGESGCGKTTAGRAILQLYRPTGGSVRFDGIELTELRGRSLKSMRNRFQMIFQDPYASLNPRMSAGRIVAEPLVTRGESRPAIRERVSELLEMVGLNPNMANRYPHEFSGGQRQRIGIARALAVTPELIIADEPVSALDVSIQAQVINLLQELQERFDLTYMFIAHDLAVVRHISDRIAVMYLGRIVEIATRDALYDRPMHPYSVALLSAVPIPNPKAEARRVERRVILEGDVPSPSNPPTGCNFSTRCPSRERAMVECGVDCSVVEPDLAEVEPGRWVACHLFRGATA